MIMVYKLEVNPNIAIVPYAGNALRLLMHLKVQPLFQMRSQIFLSAVSSYWVWQREMYQHRSLRSKDTQTSLMVGATYSGSKRKGLLNFVQSFDTWGGKTAGMDLIIKHIKQ